MILFLSRPYDSGPAPDVYDPVFENNEWAAIIEACQNNAVPDTWLADGSCSKAMTIGGTTYTIDVIGKQHDQYADGGYRSPDVPAPPDSGVAADEPEFHGVGRLGLQYHAVNRAAPAEDPDAGGRPKCHPHGQQAVKRRMDSG